MIALWQSPEQVGWSAAKLAEARAFSGTIKTAAVVVRVGGKVVDAWGEVARHYNAHSIHKSFLLRCADIGGGRVGRRSFLKKRTKKLLSVCAGASHRGSAQMDKVFLLLFLQKKKILP